MENLHAQIGEILAEGERRQRERKKAVARDRAKAGAIGAAYAARMEQIEKAALGMVDESMHGAKRRADT